jgi:hypothetical protein
MAGAHDPQRTAVGKLVVVLPRLRDVAAQHDLRARPGKQLQRCIAVSIRDVRIVDG